MSKEDANSFDPPVVMERKKQNVKPRTRQNYAVKLADLQTRVNMALKVLAEVAQDEVPAANSFVRLAVKILEGE